MPVSHTGTYWQSLLQGQYLYVAASAANRTVSGGGGGEGGGREGGARLSGCALLLAVLWGGGDFLSTMILTF